MCGKQNFMNELRERSTRNKMLADKFYNYIKDSIPECEYQFWFRNLAIVGISVNKADNAGNNHILFEVETALQKNWLIENYYDLITETLDEVVDAQYSFQIFVLDEASLSNEKMESMNEKIIELQSKVNLLHDLLSEKTRLLTDMMNFLNKI